MERSFAIPLLGTYLQISAALRRSPTACTEVFVREKRFMLGPILRSLAVTAFYLLQSGAKVPVEENQHAHMGSTHMSIDIVLQQMARIPVRPKARSFYRAFECLRRKNHYGNARLLPRRQKPLWSCVVVAAVLVAFLYQNAAVRIETGQKTV